MEDLEPRVVRLEERSEAQSATMDYLRQDMSDLRRSMEALSTELRTEMAALSRDLRGEMATLSADLRGQMATLSADLRGEMATLSADLRGEMAALRTELRSEMAELRATFDRRFTWLVGLMVTGFVVTIGTIAGAFWGVLRFVR